MKLQEADKILEKLYPGKYRVVRYELITYGDSTETECSVYVEDKGWQKSWAFHDAINRLQGNPLLREEPQDIDDLDTFLYNLGEKGGI